MIAKKNFNKKTFIYTIAAIFGTFFILTIVLFAIGYVGVIFKQPQQAVVVVDNVCDEGIVTKYNEAQKLEKRGDTEEYTADTQTLNQIVKDIQLKNNYQNDPTCQAIIMATAVVNNDYATANDAHQKLSALRSEVRYWNNSLRVSSLEQYGVYISDMKPVDSSGNEEAIGAEQQGGN